MKVLWFTNNPPQEMIRRAGKGDEGYGGHWIEQLLCHISEVKDIELGVVTAFPGFRECSFNEASVTYFAIGQPKRFQAFGARSIDLEKCAIILEKFKPDIIHIHGSERFYGLLKSKGFTTLPTVISIQGLLNPCAGFRQFFGALSPIDILRSIRLIELPVKLGLMWQYIDIKRGAKREAKILAAVDGLLGRTEWDRAYARKYNPTAFYHHVGEIMRPPFYADEWSLDSRTRHSIIYTNAGQPRRGTENLLAAVALLKQEFPNLRLQLAGRVSHRSGYGRFLRRQIGQLGLRNQVDFLGYLDGEGMSRALSRAHVFAITSYVENSANSLAEAMLVGLPCVASYVGGMPDMVQTGDTGLLYPVDDVPVLAQKIRSIFLNDELAVRLGRNARKVALNRHDPTLIVDQLLSAYKKYCSS